MTRARRLDAFLLSREWRDGDDGVEVVLWARAAEAPVRARFARQEAVMFVPRHAEARADRRASPRLAMLDGEPVDALYFRSRRALIAERDRLRGDGGDTVVVSFSGHGTRSTTRRRPGIRTIRSRTSRERAECCSPPRTSTSRRGRPAAAATGF